MVEEQGPDGRLRFGDFQREAVLRQRRVSYNELTRGSPGPQGGKPARLKLRSIDVYRLLAP